MCTRALKLPLSDEGNLTFSAGILTFLLAVFGEERATMITKGQKVIPKRTLESGYKFRFPTIAQACGEFSKLFYEDSDGEK